MTEVVHWLVNLPLAWATASLLALFYIWWILIGKNLKQENSSIHTNGGTGEAQPEAGAKHKEEVAIAIEGFHIYIKTRHDKEDAQAKKQAKLSIATAVFAFIAAVATAFAAGFTWESLGYASDAVKASQDAAASSRIAASEAVTQTRIQALANRPYLIFDVVDVHVRPVVKVA